ncbi:MAG TPA: Imm26 family immunity protein [Thermoanaerobaculia bacterium]|jgi:hypothetical protein|nr:Imm26 family immunity protein [Thermoanaerobaculia bacterium]
MKKQRVRPGHILEIPLPNGLFAYGKVHREDSIGVYDLVTSTRPQLPILVPFRFHVFTHIALLNSGKWPRIGREGFSTPEDEWPPPASVYDLISGGWSVYHHGEMRPSTREEAGSLETAQVWYEDHIIGRILEEMPGQAVVPNA